MALIKCVDCGKEVSDRASVCPNCGCPIECSLAEASAASAVQASAVEKTEPESSAAVNEGIDSDHKKKWWILGGVVITIVAIVLIAIVNSNGSGYTNYVDEGSDSDHSESDTALHTHQYTSVVTKEATCAMQGIKTYTCSCGDSYKEKISMKAHRWEYKSATAQKECRECGMVDYASTTPKATTTTAPPATTTRHTHWHTSQVTREATCAMEGVRTYTCSCGDSYTEAISKTSHYWESATCTKPNSCRNCGATNGEPRGHNYYSSGKCSSCGAMDPLVESTLSACSLSLPSVPKTVNYKGYNGSLYSTTLVTNISYKFEYEGDGTVSLTVYFSGQKTYDYRGSGQSDRCRIGWKLYDANGNVYNTGTFTSPSIAMGESFSSQEEDVIYNFHNAKPGAYRLEILDVN